MPNEPNKSNKRVPPGDFEQRGITDQVIVPSIIAASGGAGIGVGTPIGQAIANKLGGKQPPSEKPPSDE